MNASGHIPTTNAVRICLLALLIVVVLIAPATAQPTDPRAPDAITLPELGRLNGTLRQVTAMDESFGRQIYPVGDVDGDDGPTDWILTHRRCDTSFGGYAVIELLLYHGVRGGLPSTSAGIRIGPSEIDADCSFIGAGDYDGDGHRDIAISQGIRSDPYTAGANVASIVVYWNDGAGRFSIADTTHLTAPTERIVIMETPDNELSARVPIHCDLDADGAEDLVVAAYPYRLVDTSETGAARLSIFRGHRGGRWGRGGIGASPEWQFWRAPYTRRLTVVDHDGDGLLDIAMYIDDDAIGHRGAMSVLYGRRGALPDTGSIEQIAFVRIDGHDGKQGQLIDLTGDRVPELILSTGDTTNGTSWRWLIYVGRRNQRLSQQYGSGNDAPRPGDSLWWGRPWTEIWTPHHFDPAWNSPFYYILDPGDIGLDGVQDFCAGSYPGVVCYNGGSYLDSWIDAGMNLWPVDELHRATVAKLGDVDRSGRSSLGVPLSGGGVAFVGSSPSVPRGGQPIRLPEGTDRPLSAPTAASDRSALSLTLAPTPAMTYVRIEWPVGSLGTGVALLDLDGRELRRWLLPPGVAELAVDLTGLPAGVYLISVVSDGRQATMPFVHVE